MYDLIVNLAASVIAGGSVWLAQRLLRYRRLARKRAFFGLAADAPCVLVAPRHFSSPRSKSVHRQDVQALVELATIVKECGARPEVVAADEVPAAAGRTTEFCVGGPGANSRTAVHFRAALPGVGFPTLGQADEELILQVGDAQFRRTARQIEYVLVARVRPTSDRLPVVLLAGQTAAANAAAARFLAHRHRELYRDYRGDRAFCLVLRVVEPDRYGLDRVELVADVTEAALAAPMVAAPAGTGDPVP